MPRWWNYNCLIVKDNSMKSKSLKNALDLFNTKSTVEGKFEVLNDNQLRKVKGGRVDCTCKNGSTYIDDTSCTCNNGSTYVRSSLSLG